MIAQAFIFFFFKFGVVYKIQLSIVYSMLVLGKVKTGI